MAENGEPRIALFPQPRSHQFVARDVLLREPAMVGRSVARTRITPTNLIFDCRVLSRSHAVVWYDNRKFYIKDTKSSNGTFVNDRRLSRSGEESGQYELKTGDVVQFGVNVEGPSRVTHGCIIGKIQLFLGNRELPGHGDSPQDQNKQQVQVDGVTERDIEDALRTVQNAYRSEIELEAKLAQLQKIVLNAKTMATENMMAIVKEDQLLSRLEMMENQLRLYTQDLSEDDIKSKLKTTLEEKHKSEEVAKDQIQSLLTGKATSAAELVVVKQQLEDAKNEVHRLTARLEELKREHEEEQSKVMDQLRVGNELYKQLEESFTMEKAMAGQREEELKRMLQETKEELDSVKEKLQDVQKDLEMVREEKLQLQRKLDTMAFTPTTFNSKDVSLEMPLTARDFASLLCEAVILKGQVILMSETVEERDRQLRGMQGIQEGMKSSVLMQPESVMSTLMPGGNAEVSSGRSGLLEKDYATLQETVKQLTARNSESTTALTRERGKMAALQLEKDQLADENLAVQQQLTELSQKVGTGSTQITKEGTGKEESNPLVSALVCFSVGVAIASIFYYYLHNRV